MGLKYLVMVDRDGNHNKYYKMTPNGNGTWTAEYGRVGSKGMRRTYPTSMYLEKLYEKQAKGYKDQTHLYETAKCSWVGGSEYEEIDDEKVKEIVDMLLAWSNNAIKSNYTIDPNSVTSQMVSEAQSLINLLTQSTHNLGTFNYHLNKLFETLPRKMRHVEDYLAKMSDLKEYNEIIEREQSLLDVMAGRVVTPLQVDTPNQAKGTVLDAYGLKFSFCDPQETGSVLGHMDVETRKSARRVWKVANTRQRAEFEKYCKEKGIGKSGIKYYYHGSRNRNYWNIITQGLKLRPSTNVVRAGNMFGHGLYFAPKAGKSAGYTSLNGSFWSGRLGEKRTNTAALLVFKVAMGKQKHMYAYDPGVSGWTERDAQRAGVNSIFAHAGVSLRNDEAIVFNDNACTVSYLIELKN